jgi:hypothetical protein
MRRVKRVGTLAFLCLGACATTPVPEPRSSMSIGSGYSLASTDVPRARGGTGVAMATEVDAALVARPDGLLMEARIQAEDASANRALAQAQTAAGELVTRLQQATAGAATLTMCGTRVTPITGKISKAVAPAGAPTDAFEVTLEGRIEVALAAELDYWKRSALVVALAELADSYDRARDAAKSGGKGDRVSLSNMRVVVKNPESHRGKLTELWVQRARAFAAAAQAHEAPLYLLDCAPPGEIVQKERSLEEIALTLSVSCRLGSLKAPPSGPPAR